MRGRTFEIQMNRPAEAATAESAGATVESVSSLTRRIKDVLEANFPPAWVRGEISNFRAQASGHLYFSLKDTDAQISCVMFRGDHARGGRAVNLRDGAQVLLFGQISVYEPRGNYQLIVRAAVDDGLGRLQLEYERLKQQLADEGLFDPDRKTPLPDLPRTIGFVTSPTGAAVQDFIRILKRRDWRGRLIVLPTKVQGDGAAADMIATLNLAETLTRSKAGPVFDLLVIGRGGGSLEDLWAFNSEALARTIAGCAIPIISAVGHEIDFTLCDFVADVRAETPSAAAELISSRFLDSIERLRQASDGLDELAGQYVDGWREHLEVLRSKLGLLSPIGRIEQSNLRIDDLANRLASAVRHGMQDSRAKVAEAANRLARLSPEPAVARAGERLRAVGMRLDRELRAGLDSKRQHVSRFAERLESLGPERVLQRGFVILSDEGGRSVSSVRQVKAGRRVSARFRDGERKFVAE